MYVPIIQNRISNQQFSFQRRPRKEEEADLHQTIENGFKVAGVKERIAITHGSVFPATDRDTFIGSPYGEGAKEWITFLKLYGFNGNQLGPNGALADKNYYGGKVSISTTPKFSFMFRGGLLDEFTISLHYGIQLSSVTNTTVTGTNIAPMVIGGSLYGNIMLTRFDNFSVQISMPLKVAFYYGIGARWASIDAGYAEDALNNYLYDDNGERATDSMRFYILVPAKFETKLGAFYAYIMPRLMFEGNIFKTDGYYNMHYGVEGEMRMTLIENLTFGLTAYAEGQGIMRKSADFNIYNAFGGGIDVWGIWRY